MSKEIYTYGIRPSSIGGDYLVLDKEGLLDFLKDEELNIDIESNYDFKILKMTETEFKNLQEYRGW